MEELKSLIPTTLKQEIFKSTRDDLHSTCSKLIHFLQNLPLVHEMVRDLTDTALCEKNNEAALEAKANGNISFSIGDYSSALRFYSQALRVAPTDAEDRGKNLVATLYVNRASTLHRLGLFLESLRDCNRALIISPAYVKAWFRRAKANSSLDKSEEAIKDLNVALKIETSLSGKRQLQNELDLLLNKSGLNSVTEKPNDESSDESVHAELQCVSTTMKGRGMTSSIDIPMGSLIFKEDPYAAILLKPCRETHCAFCFNVLPADTVPCASCSIPLYCSLKCQVQAGGREFTVDNNRYDFPEDLSDDLEQYAKNVTSTDFISSNIEYAAEHRHECRGMHWPAVLPSNVVLAGRILVKHREKQSCDHGDPKIDGILDLCENYEQLPSEAKLEFHVYSIILPCCLQQSYASKLPLNSGIASEIIKILSRLIVNNMAIVRMKYSDEKKSLDYDVTNSVEQVPVAQAVYSGGSLFNHSCQPNAHAYFLSRTLFVRATENVIAGSELELSYGPEVGQAYCSERRKVLEDRYSFICQCTGCSQVNLSDLVHHGYRCIRPNCFGVVLESRVAEYEKEKVKHCKGPKPLQLSLNDDNIRRVASRLFEQKDYDRCFEPSHCLSCGSLRDILASQETIAKANIPVKRLRDGVASCEIATSLITDALKSLDSLRTVLHPFNKRIAEVEDNIAQAFCFIGEDQVALGHCQASIDILEKLYGGNHIVIGMELIKLASIQLKVDPNVVPDTMSRIVHIFSRYGCHGDDMFQNLKNLKEVCRTD